MPIILLFASYYLQHSMQAESTKNGVIFLEDCDMCMVLSVLAILVREVILVKRNILFVADGITADLGKLTLVLVLVS